MGENLKTALKKEELLIKKSENFLTEKEELMKEFSII